MSADELFDIIDDATGEVIGTAPRKRCHGDPSLIHRSVHIVVFNTAGQILLQKRNLHKDIQPGKWDTAVGGHLACGENFETAARRELAEELGIKEELELQHLFDSRIRNEIESENIRVFGVKLAGPFDYQRSEIDGVRFWNAEELADPANRREFTPNLLTELEELKKCGFYPPQTR